MNQNKKWKEIGSVGWDAGCLLIADPFAIYKLIEKENFLDYNINQVFAKVNLHFSSYSALKFRWILTLLLNKSKFCLKT